MTDPAPRSEAPPADPIRKTLTVPLAPAAAFDLFTAGIDRWWPKDTHSLAARTGDGARARVRVEPREGGHVIETLPDGTEAPWGTVTAWEPGARVALDWYVGRGPGAATQVEVRFTADGTGTRVDLVHSGFAVHGAEAGSLLANYTTGWDRVLIACYGSAASSRAA